MIYLLLHVSTLNVWFCLCCFLQFVIRSHVTLRCITEMEWNENHFSAITVVVIKLKLYCVYLYYFLRITMYYRPLIMPRSDHEKSSCSEKSSAPAHKLFQIKQ